uniref:Uncharacterized protein n=1 Tax=Human herpesvirus 2 TaxID=10310 RepID=A0A481TCC7_HHV2|nr:hypothetical protein [Human alphaherpesvirus 2]QBH78578.1 hypothetical protein [Human alphaherpesvirus 2]
MPAPRSRWPPPAPKGPARSPRWSAGGSAPKGAGPQGKRSENAKRSHFVLIVYILLGRSASAGALPGARVIPRAPPQRGRGRRVKEVRTRSVRTSS